MSQISETVKDGAMKSSFNQQDSMQSMLEDCHRARSGWGKPFARVSPNFRQNYDNIKWEHDNG